MITGNDQSRQTEPIKVPYITIILVVLNLIYYVILCVVGNVEDTRFMITAGANYGPLVFEKLQIWRLITSMFMHFGVSHLISNMIYLAITGYLLEKTCGHFKFLLMYMLSGIGASLVSSAYYYVAGTNTVSAGASGAIYGLLGVFTYLTVRGMKNMRPMYILYRLAVTLVFVFYSSFLSDDVDGAAHIGGFLFGVVIAILFLGVRKHEKR